MQTLVRRFLPVLAAALAFVADARAERIFPVNGTAGTFDQPSVAANGNTIHVAFVGNEDNDIDNTQLYYAAVNGAADFTNLSTSYDNQVRVTGAVAIGIGAYSKARHPQIAVRSANQLVVLFQALRVNDQAAGYKLFRALISLDNNAVKTEVIHEIKDSADLPLPGTQTDPSFGLVTADNTLRVAYVDNAVHVLYARVSLDNAHLVDAPIWLTNPLLAASTGDLPLPRLRLDGLNRSHIVWAANSKEISGAASGVYYALVKQASPGVDSLAIGATQVLAGGYRWGFPNVLVQANSRILVLAADEPSGPYDDRGIAGSIGVSLLNPDGVVQNGLPVNSLNLGSNASFFLTPPGQSVLAAPFDAYRPEAALDSSNRVYVAAYGSPETPGRFYAMSVSGVTTTTTETAQMASFPVPVGSGDFAFAETFPLDYTRPAFVRYSGKAVLFWSGPATTGGRNLYVTTVPSATDPTPATAAPAPTKQSGCSVVEDPGHGEAGRIPGVAVLLLPAALLWLRKAARKAFGR